LLDVIYNTVNHYGMHVIQGDLSGQCEIL